MEPNVTRILSQTNFAALDWVIVFSYLAISLVIGLMVRRYVKNMTDYIGAGRALGTWLGIATMSGTEMGLITIMYGAQKGFSGGFAAFHIALVAGVVTFFVGVSGFIVARLRALEVLTIPEFYQLRFDRRTRVLGGVMLALGGILNMGLFLKIGSMFLVGVTGLSSHGSTLHLVMIFLLTLVLIYTVLGGMLSVVITDYIQFIVLSGGLLLAVFLTVQHLGWDPIFQTLIREMGPRGFDPFLNEGEFGIIYVLWMAFTGRPCQLCHLAHRSGPSPGRREPAGGAQAVHVVIHRVYGPLPHPQLSRDLRLCTGLLLTRAQSPVRADRWQCPRG